MKRKVYKDSFPEENSRSTGYFPGRYRMDESFKGSYTV
jgi:hypothetical protein